jgi:hypothetical protein
MDRKKKISAILSMGTVSDTYSALKSDPDPDPLTYRSIRVPDLQKNCSI